MGWGKELVSAADLQTTDLERLRTPRVYKHGQYAHERTVAVARMQESISDDHHSPVKPDVYLTLRLQSRMRFYQQRLPAYAWKRFLIRTVVQSAPVHSILRGALLLRPL